MIARTLADYLLKIAKYYQVVSLYGPRQSGKTTLVKELFKNYEYRNLDAEDVLISAKRDPRAFLMQGKASMIIDEIQKFPALLGYIKEIVDERQIKGQFVLTGSNQPSLGAAVSESLAGRTGIAELMPLSLEEMKNAGLDTGNRNELLYSGFMPGIYGSETPPGMFYGSYFRTYVERDIRQMVNIADLDNFELFLRLLAGRVGQVINYSSLSDDSGVSLPTIKKWLSILQASYVIFKLQPYYENFGKRQVKAPKIYFTEPGLACFLIGIRNAHDLATHPLTGGIFENMAVAEARKYRLNRGMEPDLYFYRASNGAYEVDLIIQDGATLYPREIKSSSTYNEKMGKGLEHFCKLTDKAKEPLVVYSGSSFSTLSANYADSRIWCK